MPSLKSHLVAFILRHSRKPSFASPEALRRRIGKARRTERHAPPAGLLRARIAATERNVAGSPVYDVAPRGLDAGRPGAPHVLYLHGGAYCFEITPFHWRLIAEMAERLGACLTVPIYPLAPERDIHAVLAACLAAYGDLLERVDPADIVLMGDSAGGNLAVVLTMEAARRGLPLPAKLVLISPGLDMTLENPETYAVEPTDPWLCIAGGLEAIRLYGAGLDRSDWRISPITGDMTVLPPTLAFAGTRDILTPDTIRFARKAAAAGVDFELVVEPGMFHVWPLIDMPEARRARDRIVAFIGGTRPSVQSRPPSLSASIVARM